MEANSKCKGVPPTSCCSCCCQLPHQIHSASFSKSSDSRSSFWSAASKLSLRRAAGLFLLLFNLVGVCHANPDAKRLYDDLLSNYNRLVRPVSNHTEQITVKLGVRLSQLVELVKPYISLFEMKKQQAIEMGFNRQFDSIRHFLLLLLMFLFKQVEAFVFILRTVKTSHYSALMSSCASYCCFLILASLHTALTINYYSGHHPSFILGVIKTHVCSCF